MNYSKRQLEALGEPLGESVTQLKPGGFGRIYGGGGGGGPTQSTVTQTNIPEWLRPQTEALLGAATQEYFSTRPTTYTDPETGETKSSYDITGIKPFSPYSTRPQDYIAGFSPLQQQAQYEASGMQRPGEFGLGSQYADVAAMGGIGGAQEALGYGLLGAGYGTQAAGMSPQAQRYGQTAANIGRMGLRAEALGRDVGREARQYASQAAGMGGTYERMATNPYATAAYMSPYMTNVLELQKEAAVRDAQKSQLAQNLGAARQGTYGGSRQLIANLERERMLGSQLSNIEAQGRQKAFEDAQRAQQFAVTTGLQGLQGAQAGLGTALQGGQLGLSGIGQAISGQQAGLAGLGQAGQLYGLGMQGAGVGLQGVQGALSGYGLTGQQAANLANIANQQQAADIARMQFQGQVGAGQQAQEQRAIDQAVQNYAMAQQYPYQQLAGYSGLLRGYSTPTTTVSQYQAAPSAMSQLSGLGLTGAAMYGMMKKEGGAIKEKKYAGGGLTDIDRKIMARPTAFPPDVISKGMANDSISDIVGAIALNEIGTAKKKAQQANAMSKGAPQGTILADLQQQATGIDTLPTNLPPVSAAGGGIVAFEDGGHVQRFQNQGVVEDPASPFGRWWKGQQKAGAEEMERQRLRNQLVNQYGPKAGVFGFFSDQTDAERQAAKDLMGRIDKLTLPELKVVTEQGIGALPPVAQSTAAQPTAVKPDARIPDTATAPAAPPAPSAATQTAPSGASTAPARPTLAPPTGSALDATRSVLEGGGETDGITKLLQEKGLAPADQGIGGYFQRSEDREKRLMEALGKDRLQGKAFSEYETMLKKEGEQAGLDKDQAKYMALLKAGLSMMAGTSRHALENIGKGALVGAADYQEAYKDLRKAERERTKEFALIEQARRAESRDDLKRRDELLMRASDAAQKRDDFGTNAMLNAGIEDRRTATDIWKTQYGGQVQMRGQDITLQAARERASALANRGLSITPAQLAKFRENAMKSIDQNAIRSQVAKETKLSKVPAPGADATFDKRVNAAYEKAINAYIQQVMGGVGSSASSLGFSLVGSSED